MPISSYTQQEISWSGFKFPSTCKLLEHEDSSTGNQLGLTPVVPEVFKAHRGCEALVTHNSSLIILKEEIRKKPAHLYTRS